MRKRIYFFWVVLVGGCSLAFVGLGNANEKFFKEAVAACIDIQLEISNPWINDWLHKLALGSVQYEAEVTDHSKSSHYIINIRKKEIVLDGESIACHVSKTGGQLLMAGFYKGSPESVLTREVLLVSGHDFSGGVSQEDIETIAPIHRVISAPWGIYGE